jgi:outer membrane protein assembly factor BamD (BamD/ComL family)
MCRFWAAAFLVLWVGAGCGDSASEIKSTTPAQGSAVPSEPDTETGLYARAQAAEQQGQAEEAVRLYRQILERYPESPNNYKATFLIGFVFSEKLEEPDSARLMFEAVIRDYPDCEFVDDAQAMLRFMKGELPPFEESPPS